MQRGRNRQRPGFAEKPPAWQVLGAGAAEPVRGPPSGQDTAGRASSPKPATAPRSPGQGTRGEDGRQPLPKDCFGRGCLLSTAAASLYGGGQFHATHRSANELCGSPP